MVGLRLLSRGAEISKGAKEKREDINVIQYNGEMPKKHSFLKNWVKVGGEGEKWRGTGKK